MTYLTPHFSLDELTLSQTAQRMGIPNTPDQRITSNLTQLAQVMERVRTMLGNKPILISSGYRCPDLNTACGGARSSAHMHGLAVDFTCPSFGTPLEICAKLEPMMEELGIDQLIWEFQAWVHLGLRDGHPRCMALSIDRNGTRSGFC